MNKLEALKQIKDKYIEEYGKEDYPDILDRAIMTLVDIEIERQEMQLTNHKNFINHLRNECNGVAVEPIVELKVTSAFTETNFNDYMKNPSKTKPTKTIINTDFKVEGKLFVNDVEYVSRETLHKKINEVFDEVN